MEHRRGRRRAAAVALALSALTMSVTATTTTADADAPGSVSIGCDQAEARVTVATTSHLDPTCTYHGGFDVVSSNVTLDCRGATILDPGSGSVGVAVTAPTTVALTDITVRDCTIEGFLNNIRITRQGFKHDLQPGHEYDDSFSDIVVEDVKSRRSRGVGIFVDGYVTGVTLRRVDVSEAGSTGIYLEGSSKDNVVEGSSIHDNGFRENGPGGQLLGLGGLTFRWWGTGREGLAIDGSRGNVIRGNRLAGNAAGGLFLYKNCGEYATQKPDQWWNRPFGADGNTIEDNTFAGGITGVWVGSRMGENTLPMDCSDLAYRSSPGERVVLDHAAGNTVRRNRFNDVFYGVRVEDDRTTVDDNTFTGSDPAQQAVIIGTRTRTADLGRPVDGTVLTSNVSTISGNPSPYRWVHGHVGTTSHDNAALGAAADLCQGQQPPVSPFIFVLALALQDPSGPPVPSPPLLDQRLPALAPCTGPTTTTTATVATVATSTVGRGVPAPSAVTALPRFAG